MLDHFKLALMQYLFFCRIKTILINVVHNICPTEVSRENIWQAKYNLG